ncbi:glycosyltransferase, partial [candidate division WWE3 bacterium]|nr:glycosyltransferase [candidate division WWE3 bacterium]
MNNKKIKLLFTDHAPLVGGALIALLRHIENIDNKRFEAHLVVSPDCEDFNLKARNKLGPRFHVIPFGRLKPLSFRTPFQFITSIFHLLRLAIKLKSEVLIANVERAFYSTFIVSLILNRELILIIRDFEFSHTLLRLTRFKVSHYLVVSDKIKSFYQLPSDKTTVVYVGSDIYKIYEKISSDQIRNNRIKNINANDDDFVIGFVGRIIEWKGPFLMLEALNLLLKEYEELGLIIKPDNVKLAMLGTGPDEQEVREYINQQSLSMHVVFPGFVDNTPLWYKSFDVYVHASVGDEPYATTVIEAAFAKTPIIATNTGGTAEFIVNESTGLLIEPNVQELKTALVRTVNDADLRKNLADNAYERAVSENK